MPVHYIENHDMAGILSIQHKTLSVNQSINQSQVNKNFAMDRLEYLHDYINVTPIIIENCPASDVLHHSSSRETRHILFFSRST